MAIYVFLLQMGRAGNFPMRWKWGSFPIEELKRGLKVIF